MLVFEVERNKSRTISNLIHQLLGSMKKFVPATRNMKGYLIPLPYGV
jgi:hypothetical protein